MSWPEAKERFSSRIYYAIDGCHYWIGAHGTEGYGYFVVHKKAIKAHRFAYMFKHNTKIPDGLLVCHTCDNRLCVNPDHLFLGTNKNNTDDMIKKGRSIHPAGEDHKRHRLSNEIVMEIRANRNISSQSFAEKYNVSVDTISSARQYKTWRHVK